MQSVRIQDYLFQRIRERIPAGASLADEVSTHLYISQDSAYRRIRGETLLVLEEAQVLCAAYGLSLDEVLQVREHSIAFQFMRLNNENYGFGPYLNGIRDGLRQLAAAREREVIYLSKDIPVFYNFLFEPLFGFRYFFWMKSIMQHPDFTDRKYSSNSLPPDILACGREISQLYASLPSTEIWNTECVNSTISQVEYYREAGYFSDDSDADQVYAALRQLLEHLQVQAEFGSKFLPGNNVSMQKNNYQMFYNRMALGDNTILSVADGKMGAYLAYDVLDYMSTSDEKFCNSIHEKMRLLIRRATILSNASEKQRSIFFNTLLKKIPSRMVSINNNGK